MENNTTPPAVFTTPEPVPYKTAHAMKKAFVQDLGWDANNVMRVDFTPRFIKITARDASIWILHTVNLSTGKWELLKPAPFSHATEIL